MASTKYTYSILEDTLNGEVNTPKLSSEIKTSNIPNTLDFIGTEEDDLDIWFLSGLSVESSGVLTQIVNNHEGAADPSLETQPVNVENAGELTPGDLVVTWTQMKSFYDSVSSAAFINYIDLSTHYYVWLSYRDQKVYVPALEKGTSECIQFEASYKSKCNIAEWPRVRITTCKINKKLHDRYISFQTAHGEHEGHMDNTDWEDKDYGDAVYKMIAIDGSGVRSVTTVEAECKETWIEVEPLFDYEVCGGAIDVPSTLTGDENAWEVHVVAVPDVPAIYGGTIHFIANPRVKFKKGTGLSIDAQMNPSELKYSATNHTNKLRIIIKHPLAAVGEFQINLKLFK